MLGKINILGYSPKLYVQGNERYSSNFSTIMSILVLTTVSVLSIYFTVDFFQRTKATIIYEQSSDFQKKIDLSNFPILFKICNSVGAPFDPRITYPIATYWNLLPENNGAPVITNLKYQSCKKNGNFGDYGDIFSNFTGLENYNCLSVDPSQNLALNGTYGDISVGYGYILIYMARCVNGSQYNPGVTCAPQSQIDSTLASLNPYMYTVTLDTTANHQNVDAPLQVKTRVDQLLFPPLALYRHDINVKKIHYSSDEGLVLQNPITYESVGFQSTESFIYFGSKFRLAEAYGIHLIKLYDKQDQYTRYYQKLQNLAANIGRIMKLLISVGAVISNYISSQFFIFELLSKFASINEKDDDKLSQIKVSSFNNYNKEMVSQHSNSHAIIKNYTPRKELKFSFKEALLPGLCLSRKTSKHLVFEYNNLYRRKFSVEFILKYLIDFEKLKKVVLDDTQLKLFNRIRNPTIFESKTHLEFIFKDKDTKAWENIKGETDEVISKLSGKPNHANQVQDYITKSLINQCNK